MKVPADTLNGSLCVFRLASTTFFLAPIRFDDSGYRPSHKWLTLNFCAFLVFLAGCVYLEKDHKVAAGSSSVSEASGWADLYSGTISQMAGILLNCLHAKRIAHFLNRVRRIDRKLGLLARIVSYRRVFVLSTAGVLVVVAEFLCTFGPDYYFFVKDESVLYLMYSYLPIVVTGLVKVQLVTFAFLLGERIEYVAAVLKGLVVAELPMVRVLDVTCCGRSNMHASRHFTDTVESARAIYDQICVLMELLNDLYGVQVFLMFVSTFLVCITELYYAYAAIVNRLEDEGPLDVYFSLQWALLQTLEVFAVAYFCDSVHIKVEGMKLLIHQLMIRSNDRDVNIVLKKFSLQEMHRNPKFTACGFFPIDFSMVQMLCGLVTTYLIIIIQLDSPKSRQDIKNSVG